MSPPALTLTKGDTDEGYEKALPCSPVMTLGHGNIVASLASHRLPNAWFALAFWLSSWALPLRCAWCSAAQETIKPCPMHSGCFPFAKLALTSVKQPFNLLTTWWQSSHQDLASGILLAATAHPSWDIFCVWKFAGASQNHLAEALWPNLDCTIWFAVTVVLVDSLLSHTLYRLSFVLLSTHLLIVFWCLFFAAVKFCLPLSAACPSFLRQWLSYHYYSAACLVQVFLHSLALLLIHGAAQERWAAPPVSLLIMSENSLGTSPSTWSICELYRRANLQAGSRVTNWQIGRKALQSRNKASEYAWYG